MTDEDLNITQEEIDALRSIQWKCYQRSLRAGWHSKPRDDGTFIALIHSEISEAMEGFRKDLNDDHLPHRKMAEVEFADAIIRILDCAEKNDFNIGEALAEKHDYNGHRADHKLENRAKQHGKKF